MHCYDDNDDDMDDDDDDVDDDGNDDDDNDPDPRHVAGTPQITVGENLQAEKMGRVSCTAEYTGPFMETDPERIPGITGMIQDETKTGDVTHRPGDAQVNPIVEYVSLNISDLHRVVLHTRSFLVGYFVKISPFVSLLLLFL